MNELERVQRMPDSWRKPEQTLALQAAIARLAGRLGRIRVHKDMDGRCVYFDQWVLPVRTGSRPILGPASLVKCGSVKVGCRK